jgi:hypothetical protein
MINQIEEETGALPPNLPRGVPADVASANPDVEGIIKPRINVLMEIANSFLSTIIDTLDSVPYGIRWICKQIRSLTRVSCFSSHDSRGAYPSAESSGSTLTRRMALSARSSAVSSSCGSSIRPLSLRVRISHDRLSVERVAEKRDTEGYMLVDGVPSKHPRRTLTLVGGQPIVIRQSLKPLRRSPRCFRTWRTSPCTLRRST